MTNRVSVQKVNALLRTAGMPFQAKTGTGFAPSQYRTDPVVHVRYHEAGASEAAVREMLDKAAAIFSAAGLQVEVRGDWSRSSGISISVTKPVA